MMHSFQRLSDQLINILESEEGGVSMHAEGSQNPTSNHVYGELEKVKFQEFWGATDGHVGESLLENMEMCFVKRDYSSNLMVCMGIF
jgi:hypothetical protein